MDGGYVGLINANSFMKREFGKGLVEKVLPRLDLNEVVDTSGAFIPGHGTPTVILFGRHRRPVSEKVRVVMGRRGEPETPADPAKGKVWSSIAANIGNVGFENEYVTVADVARATLAKHPWSLGGGGASELKDQFKRQCSRTLGEVVDGNVGFGCITKMDDVFSHPAGVLRRYGVEPSAVRWFVVGENVRDWRIDASDEAVFPYESDISLRGPTELGGALRYLWPYRTSMYDRKVFGGQDYREVGRSWYEYGQIPKDRYRTPFSITFAFIATHNHFVFDRDGMLFNRSAPVMKLGAESTERDHLALVAWLNSSACCFWMKQVCQPKGATSANHNHPDPARFAYEFSATAVESLPVLADIAEFSDLGQEIFNLSRDRAELLSAGFVSRALIGGEASDVRSSLAERWLRADRIRERLIFLQEEVDWLVYVRCGFASDDCLSSASLLGDPSVLLPRGQRAFERIRGHLSLVRGDGQTLDASEAEVKSDTVVDPRLAALIDCRADVIRGSSVLMLVESNVYKRLWRDTEDNVGEPEHRSRENRRQLAEILSELVEDVVKSSEAPIGLDDVHHEILTRPTGRTLVALLSDDDGRPLIQDLLTNDSVPYLAAMRHTDEGLRKRAHWEHTWDLQRREDAGETLADIPVPPKYDQKDYREARYWSLRGKLDVPRERFIAYPGAETDPRAPLFGWAGWDHLQRARALATVYNDRRHADGWDRDRLRPLLAGLLELVPWLMQWHDAPDPELDGQGQGRMWHEFVEGQRHELRWSEDELRAWRPATTAEKKAAKKAAKAKG